MPHSISRRAVIAGASAIAAWAVNPASAALQATDTAGLSTRIADLLARMSVDEKAGQLSLMFAAWRGGAAAALNPVDRDASFAKQLDEVRSGKLGGVFNGHGAEMARQMQAVAIREGSHRIPLIFAADIIHGCRTIFPVPLGEAASFEPALAVATGHIAAKEAAALGIDWVFAPMVDIARDQRWGRGVEGAGEDVLLGQLFAAARVQGFQGNDLRASDAVMACVKHFAAYGAAIGGLDYNTVDISERTLREIYFPPFQKALNAGAGSVMASFNELSGIPATGNHWLLTDVLRDEWRFDGVVVSDYTADEEMIAHGFATDARDATRLAFMAGVDMCMQSGFYRDHLPALVAAGDVPMARLNQAVGRVLTMKEHLGLFDDPFRRIDPRRERQVVMTAASRTLARSAATKSIVMLKNDNDVLPLRRQDQRIALIGPFAEGLHDLVGPWVVYGDNAQAIDLATGIRSAMRDPSLLRIETGSGVEHPIAGGIDAAIAAAKTADIVILAIGEAETMSGESQSRTDVVVPPAQQVLAEAVAATGKPVVVVLKNGRALALEGAVRDASAILVTWFLGTESGNATADILFGIASPSARLPVSFPIRSGQQPYHYDHKPTGRPNPPGPLQPFKAHFSGIPNEALYPFGHGLTYGRISYADLDIGEAVLRDTQPLRVGLTISNAGTRDVEEVVQLYVRDRSASITRPVRELKGFQKIHLAAGGTQRVDFTLTRKQLLFIGQEMKWTVEAGLFDLWVAPSAQAEGLKSQFTLL